MKLQEIDIQIQESIDTKETLFYFNSDIKTLTQKVIRCFELGHKVLIFGNGGSAADAQHIAAELPGLPIISLNTNASILTAIANDYGYEDVFLRQLDRFVKSGDIVIGMTTSGKSANVLKALRRAKSLGATTIALTGIKGLKEKTADFEFKVPSESTQRIQEAHMLIGHIITNQVKKECLR